MLANLDLAILRFFNIGLANPVFDVFFKTITMNQFLLCVLAVILASIIWKDHKKGAIIAIVTITGLALADIISADILKKLFCRPRPCHAFSDLRMIVGCGGKYGFPSNHAANSVVVAFILTRFYKKLNPFLWTLAVMVCISRMYLGKHYPSDLLGGALLGLLVGLGVLYLARTLYKPLSQSNNNTISDSLSKQGVISNGK
jgi:undecaprenyl-diphosphatase